MSILACKLYEEREEKEDNYLPLLCSVFGQENYDPALNENKAVAELVDDALEQLADSNYLGCLQRYVLEEHFLHGKSREEIGKEFMAHMDTLLNDLINPAIRFLRHPSRARELSRIVRKEVE